MGGTTPTQLPFDWTPPEGIEFSCSWCSDMRAWRVRLKGPTHAESIYVPDEGLTPASLDILAARFVAQSGAFAVAGRAVEGIFGESKREQ